MASFAKTTFSKRSARDKKLAKNRIKKLRTKRRKLLKEGKLCVSF